MYTKEASKGRKEGGAERERERERIIIKHVHHTLTLAGA